MTYACHGPTSWSERHREDQEAYCRRFVTPVIAGVALRSLSRAHFQVILDAAPTASVVAHLRRCLSAMVAAALEEGLLLARQDVLRGVRWHPPAQVRAEAELERGRAVETRHRLTLGPPKSRRKRPTMYPARTPGGVDLAALVGRRPGRWAPTGWSSPHPGGGGPGAPTTGATSSIPRRPPPARPAGPTGAGSGASTACATCSPPGPWTSPGPASPMSPGCWATPPCRVTQDLYIAPDGDLYDRFFTATA